MQNDNKCNYVWEEKLSGPLPIKLTNDFFFKYLQQSNDAIFKAIVKAFIPFQIPVYKLELTNPISDSDVIDAKSMILDVKAFLNEEAFVNLEMQVINNHNWPERSLSYLARTFDNLKRGEDYNNVRGSYHISFLNFTLFEKYPEFVSEYHMLNINTLYPLTSKLGLTMVDLTHIELATDEDISSQRDLWAMFFKATTWEELYMLAEKNSIFNETTVIIRQVSEEEHLRQLYEAREDQLRQQRDFHKYYNNLIAAKDAEIADKDAEIADKDAEIAELKRQLNAK